MNLQTKLRGQGLDVETVADILGDPDPAFRQTVVGASEVSALFDASPYLTHFELWHRKRGNIATPELDGERIEWGIRLERPIIEAARDRYGYELRETPRRLDNGKGLGGHPDQIAWCPERQSIGILEVKTADWLVAKKWGDEPPLHYLLQNLTYQGLVGAAWGDVIVLVGGNELRRFKYEFRAALYSEIETRVVDFWSSVRACDPPKPDFTRDGKALAEVIGEPTDTSIDLRHDNHASELADQYLAAKAVAKAYEKEAEALKTELLMKIGPASFAMLPVHSIGAAMTKGSAGTLITADMVGTTIGARKGYRRFDIKEI